MSNILPINNSIVPAHVTQGYLKGYSEVEQQAFAAVYDGIKENALKKLSGTLKSSTPTVLLVAGSQGSGKSKLVDSLLGASKENFVECDVDSILKQMPVVREEIERAENEFAQDFEIAGTAHYDPKAHRAKVESAVHKFRPAAKYISDRLMSECIAEGINVIVETNAKTPHITNFIEALKSRDVLLEGHIIEAPLPLKIKSARTPEHGFAFPESVLVSENEAFRENVPAMVAALKDNVTIWFRLRENGQTKMVASMIGGRFKHGEALDTFDALFSEVTKNFDVVSLFCLSRQIPITDANLRASGLTDHPLGLSRFS